LVVFLLFWVGAAVAGLGRVSEVVVFFAFIVRSQFRLRGKMRKTVIILVALLAIGTAIWAFFANKSSQKNPNALASLPPLTGSMKNFIPTDKPGPTLKTEALAKSGELISLKKYRGKIVLVNFWATWCGPCIREMPSLANLQKKRGGSDFTVLALSQDLKEWERVSPFLNKLRINKLPVYVDRNMRIARTLKVVGLPTTVMFSKKGVELGRLNGIAEWDTPQALQLIDHYRNLN